MNISKETNRNGERLSVQIWRCERCAAVHFKAGNVLLNFTKDEFADLAYRVNDVFQSEFGSLEFYDLLSTSGDADEITASNLIL